jgi:hypothetical protein
VSDVDDGGVVLNVDGGRMQELDYVEVHTTEPRDEHTRGGCELSTKRRGRQGLYKVCTREDV